MLKNAIRKQLAGKTTASLYLSGGIDSALIGLYLKDLGVRVTTFTSLTELQHDAERQYLDLNIKSIEPKAIHIQTTEKDYGAILSSITRYYKQPFGNMTALAVANIWNTTPIDQSEIIFHGQNSDVINNAMDNGHVTGFGFPFYSNWFTYLNYSQSEMFNKYASSVSHGLLTQDPTTIAKLYGSNTLHSFQLVALAGLYFRRTPVDSELLSQPAINQSVAVGNPFYDVDVIEYLLSLSIRHKLQFKKHTRFPLSLDKRVLQSIAVAKDLPKELVYRKNGFVVSRQDAHQDFFSQLPNKIQGVTCQTLEQKFAAHILNLYLQNKFKN